MDNLLGLYNWQGQPLQPGVYNWEQYDKVNGTNYAPTKTKKMASQTTGGMIIDNAGEIFGGLGNLINAISGNQPVTNVYMPAQEEVKRDNTIYYVLGALILIAVLYFIFKG